MFDDERDQTAQENGRPRLLLALAFTVLVGLVFILLRPLYSWQKDSSNRPTLEVSPAASEAAGSTITVKEGQPDPPAYWQTIEENIAQGLHLSVPQVKEKLQPPPGERDSLGIAHLASEQGVSEAQLRVIEINSIQKGHDFLVQQGYLTQQGSDLGMQRIRDWDQATLDNHVTGWFLNN